MIVHAPYAGGDDRTLCGDALEGTEEDNFTPRKVSAYGRPITCEQCLEILNHCRKNFVLLEKGFIYIGEGS